MAKEKLTKAEKLGPTAFTSQQDYEEQVALEKGPEEKPADDATGQDPESEDKAEEKKPTEEELTAMTKDEQVAILEKLGSETIPRYEKDRVALILKLQ